MDQNLSTNLHVFQVDLHKDKKLNIGYAEINKYGHLEVYCIKFKSSLNPSLAPLSQFNPIDSFWAKVYQSDSDLPKRFILMKSISKVFDYLKDQKNRIIETELKVKNGEKKLLFKLWAPITKNIKDFVPLQLEEIRSDYIHHYLIPGTLIFGMIERKLRQIFEIRNAEENNKQIEIIQLQEKQQHPENDEQEEGQISNQFLLCQPCHKKQKMLQPSQDGQLQEEIYQNDLRVEQKLEQMNCINEEKNIQQQNSQSNESLKQQYVGSLKSRNQFLLDRILSLQCQLIKKSIRLETYQDENLQMEIIDQSIQKKYEDKIKYHFSKINQLMNNFQKLKKIIYLPKINQNQLNQQRKNLHTISEISMSNQNLKNIFEQIQEIFNQFY